MIFVPQKAGVVFSYMEICSAIGVNLQRGMNFRLRDGYSVILMRLRLGAPYEDRVEGDGKVLIYEREIAPEQLPFALPKGQPRRPL
jgi:hypothetical protein